MTIFFKGLIAGAAGVLVVTALHRLARRSLVGGPWPGMPGNQALAMERDRPVPGGSLAAKAVYSSLAGSFGANAAPFAGAFLGLAAGAGSVSLPVNRTRETEAMAIGMYVAGGIAAGAVYKALSK